MRALLVHQNFPGQFRHLAPALQSQGAEVLAVAQRQSPGLQGIQQIRYDPCPNGEPPPCHPWVRDSQNQALRAEAVGHQLAILKKKGWIPNLIIGHSGWGELLAVKDLFPHTPVIHLMEYFFQIQGADNNFDPEFASNDWGESTRVRFRRASQMLAVNDLDWTVVPTPYQARTIPQQFHNRLSVIHEGINTDAITPLPNRVVNLAKAKLQFKPGDELVSFVNRNLEPTRGFHVFMRCLPHLQRLRPNAHVIIVGGSEISYGSSPDGGGSWKEVLLKELSGQLDLSRIHFVGKIPHDVLHDVFRVCSCHVYLTYPFVLSWSLLEAMSCGAVVIGSDTAPLQDVISPGHNGLMVNFFNTTAMAETIATVLSDYERYRHLGRAARRTIVDRFDLNSICLPKMLQLVEDVVAGSKGTNPCSG